MKEIIISNKLETDEVSLKEIIHKFRDWFRYLLSQWIIIIGISCIGSIIGYIYASHKPPLYTASTTFVLEGGEKSGGVGQYAGLAAMAGIDIAGGSGSGIFQSDNLPELYKSRTMIEKTLLSPIAEGSSKLLVDRYLEINRIKEKWIGKPDLQKISFRISDKAESSKVIRIKDSILGSIVVDINRNYLTVSKPDKKLSIIKVDVKATDEYFAKSFNDQIVNNVNEFYIYTKTKKAQNNVNILQHKTDSVKAVMNGAIYASATVSDATPNLNPTRQVQRSAPMQRSQFTAESNKSVLALLVQNLEMSKMSLLQETPLIQVVDKPIFPLEKYKLGRAFAMIIGGVIAGFLTVIILLLRKVFSNVLN